MRILQIGGLPEILAAMQGGSIQGGAISSPTLTRAKLLGYRELVDLGTLGIKYPVTSYMTTDSYIKSHRPTVTAFLKAIIEAAYFVKTNKEVSINVLRKYTKTHEMPILEDTYQIYAQRYIRLMPTSSGEEVKPFSTRSKTKIRAPGPPTTTVLSAAIYCARSSKAVSSRASIAAEPPGCHSYPFTEILACYD